MASYKFKYQVDKVICRNGAFYSTYEDFMAENVGFPIVENQFFEYRENGAFDIITLEGHHVPQEDLTNFNTLIIAINALS